SRTGCVRKSIAGCPIICYVLWMEEILQVENALRVLPRDWQAKLKDSQLEPVTSGMSGAFIFRVLGPTSEAGYLKLASAVAADELLQEIARTEWLSSHQVRVPKFLMKLHTESITAVFMTAVPGQHLTNDSDDFFGMLRSMAKGLARLHALPIGNCSFDEMPRTRLERARDAIDQNLIDASQFDDRNSGVTPAMLYQRLIGAIKPSEDIVVVHGDATLSNMLIEPNGELGFIDCGHSGYSDRYVDLALIEAELADEFGPDAAERFIN